MLILAGKYRHKRLKTPKGKDTRPTTSKLREAVFNIVQNDIENALFLDLYAGTGAIGFEALSRGAKHVYFVENNRDAIKCIQENIKELTVDNQATLLIGDVLKTLQHFEKMGKKFNIIYADAPYTHDSSQILTQWLSDHPLMENGAYFLLENSHSVAPSGSGNLQWIDSRRSGKAYLHKYLWEQL